MVYFLLCERFRSLDFRSSFDRYFLSKDLSLWDDFDFLRSRLRRRDIDRLLERTLEIERLSDLECPIFSIG